MLESLYDPRRPERAGAPDFGVPNPGYTGPARVVASEPTCGSAVLILEDERFDEPVSARIANPALGELLVGDTVLATLGEAGEAYVIGLLSHLRKLESEPEPQTLALPDGSKVEIEGKDDSAKVCLYTRTGELVLEWDPGAQRTRVCVPAGDLEFSTERGGIVFDSAEEIRFRGRSIELTSTERVQLGVKDAAGRLVSEFTMKPRRLRLKGDEVGIEAGRAKVNAGEFTCTSERVNIQTKTANLVVGRLKLVADQVIQRANDVYSKVANLSQLEAGRVRTLIESSYWMKAKRSYIRSGEEFKLDAKKIHLG